MIGLKIAATGAIFLAIAIIAAVISATGGPQYNDKTKAFLGLFMFGGAASVIGGLLTSIWF